MLEALKGNASDRKLRLFACACCRSIWHLLADDRSRSAVEEAERHAEGLLAPADVEAAARQAHAAAAELSRRAAGRGVSGELLMGQPLATAATAAACLLQASSVFSKSGVATAAEVAAGGAAAAAARAVKSTARVRGMAGRPLAKRERVTQCHLLRCVVGHPHGRLPTLDPSWALWNDGIVKRMAEAAYQERELPSGNLDAARLAVLADALEEAGCADVDVLAHLRGGGLHVRGCWVLDWVTGRG
jgi:hypothetical protein